MKLYINKKLGVVCKSRDDEFTLFECEIITGNKKGFPTVLDIPVYGKILMYDITTSKFYSKQYWEEL